MAYLKDHNLTPGMDDAQAREDATGYTTTVEMLTGGVSEQWDVGGGPVVGLAYDQDELGEDREMVTWIGGKKAKK